MKKFISFLLVAVLLVSAVPTALATNDYSQGTQVVYQATGSESYTITVPAQLAPGGNGTVTLQGTWADNRIITVTAEPTVTLTNSIKAEDQKVLNVHFDGISEAGSNIGSQTFTEVVSVDDITNALFGTWSGKFNYNVEINSQNNSEDDIPSDEARMYSFGVLSDVHVQYGNAGVAYQNALTYLKDNVDFTCVSGDLVTAGTEEFYQEYQRYVTSAGSMPVYEIAGNHETYYQNESGTNVAGTLDTSMFEMYTGDKLFYTFTHGNDVFIMVGLNSEGGSNAFTSEELKWLQQILEINKNKRCFVFQHAPAEGDTTGDPYGMTQNLMNGVGKTFVEMMAHYKNVTWFHGHTHSAITNGLEPVNNGTLLGFRSVHVPSLGSARIYTGEDDNYVTSSQHVGYIVDVYENQIAIRAIDFDTKESVYETILNTTLQTSISTMIGEKIEAGCTYATIDGIVYNAGENMPVVTSVGDEFDDGEYIYKFGYKASTTGWAKSGGGWGVKVKDNSKTSYQELRTSINYLDVDDISFAFYNCRAMITAPEIHSNIKMMERAFYHCDALTGTITINANPINYTQCFRHTSCPITLTGSSTLLNEIATTGCDSSCSECGGSSIIVSE